MNLMAFDKNIIFCNETRALSMKTASFQVRRILKLADSQTDSSLSQFDSNSKMT